MTLFCTSSASCTEAADTAHHTFLTLQLSGKSDTPCQRRLVAKNAQAQGLKSKPLTVMLFAVQASTSGRDRIPDPVKQRVRRNTGRMLESRLSAAFPSTPFPFAVRLNVDVLAADGSETMAALSAASLALADAGVPVRAQVAGLLLLLLLLLSMLLLYIQAPRCRLCSDCCCCCCCTRVSAVLSAVMLLLLLLLQLLLLLPLIAVTLQLLLLMVPVMMLAQLLLLLST